VRGATAAQVADPEGSASLREYVDVPSNRYKRFVAAGAAALILGGAALGVASAQQAPGTGTEQSREQAFLDALAKKLNISTTTLQQDIQQVEQDQGIPAGEGLFGHHGGHGGGKHL